jgi:predicted deacylase
MVSGAVHGGELIGYPVILRLLKEKLDPSKLKGLVVGIPMGNPLGFQFGERHSPQDHVTGPSFGRPGNHKGSITERIGAAVWDQVTSKMDFRVDIHGNYPPCTAFCLLNLHDSRIREKNEEMAKACGLTIVYSPPKGTLVGMSGTVDESYQPPHHISFELIDAKRITDVSIDLGVRGLLNIMKLRGMIEGEIEPQPKENVWGNGRVQNAGTLVANRGGLIYFTKTPGEFIKKGEIVAKISNPYGEILEEIKFPHDGYIRAYTYSRHQALNTGSTIAYITHDH